ncbi:hypothetical protein NPIL_163941 [Nephila pilipes]|uniref:Uncharacterized protein n=1 Tax=Nephila pilipes TaxID=299642 RepID=A0A8X6NMH9_NEPPI|nr:hypothetical protein NPIL_163941 [Nephila pilipes]
MVQKPAALGNNEPTKERIFLLNVVKKNPIKRPRERKEKKSSRAGPGPLKRTVIEKSSRSNRRTKVPWVFFTVKVRLIVKVGKSKQQQLKYYFVVNLQRGFHA